MSDKKQFRTTIGGQALIEGIMMRGPQKTAIVVRGPEKIETKLVENTSIKDKFPILKLPVLRGVVGFVESMAQGTKALTWSAEFFPEEEGEPGKLDRWLEKHGKAAEKAILAISMMLGVLLAIGLFTVLPTLLGSWLAPQLAKLEPQLGAYWSSVFLRNLSETVLRLLILLGYMVLVSQMKDIQRVFMYHGAEHKTIACYEAGDALTVENVRRHTRFHPRCGTSFLLMVVLISMLVFMWVTAQHPVLRIALRLSMLPLVVGISHEVNRLVGKYDNRLTRILRAPGLALQKLTTREPDDSMLEVGIQSLKMVLPQDSGEDEWT